MARIRSIKPEFFTSEQIAECSPNVRLMFVGMWCFSDDYGVSPASVHRIKTQVFPSDNISKEEIRAGIDKLISVGLIQEYEIDGEKYWFVTGWDKHQKPDCKTGLYPRPDGNIGCKIRRTTTEHSPNDHRTTTEHSRKEKEKEKEKEKDDIARSAKPSRAVALVDDDFLESLKENAAYEGIDIDREHGKMLAWLQTPRGRGKQPTRTRFLSWLNRCNPQDRREEPESYITCNTFEDEHGNLR